MNIFICILKHSNHVYVVRWCCLYIGRETEYKKYNREEQFWLLVWRFFTYLIYFNQDGMLNNSQWYVAAFYKYSFKAFFMYKCIFIFILFHACISERNADITVF